MNLISRDGNLRSRLATHDPYAALRVRNFLWLILGYATSTVAREAQIVVVGWQVFEATRDPLALGMIGLAEALPFIAVALYAGHVADRLPRRPIAIAGTFAMLLSAIALLLFTTSGMIGNGHVWPIYLVIFLSGIARSFIRPAFTALSRRGRDARSLRKRGGVAELDVAIRGRPRPGDRRIDLRLRRRRGGVLRRDRDDGALARRALADQRMTPGRSKATRCRSARACASESASSSASASCSRR